MAINLPVRHGTLLAGLIAFELVSLMPMRLGLSWFGATSLGLVAREGQGSIWLGRLTEARIGPAVLGDVQVRLNMLPLLLGRARFDLSDDAGTTTGALSVFRNGEGVDDVTASLPIGTTLAPMPDATMQLTDVSVHFRDGTCSDAAGRFKLTFAGDVAGVALPGGLSGSARCEGGALLLPLMSQGGMERATIRIMNGGKYNAQFLLDNVAEDNRGQALAMGFIAQGSKLVLNISGHF